MVRYRRDNLILNSRNPKSSRHHINAFFASCADFAKILVMWPKMKHISYVASFGTQVPNVKL